MCVSVFIKHRTFCSTLLCLLVALPLHAEDINVAAASDLNFAIKEVIQKFERDTGNKVRLTLGSSGSFYAQIVNGAPWDVFLSADMNYPKQLEKAGLGWANFLVMRRTHATLMKALGVDAKLACDCFSLVML